MRSRFPLPLSVKQLLVFLHEECYSIPLETIQNLYESIPRRIQAVSRQMVAQLRINKEKCIFHNCSIILSIPYMCCNYGWQIWLCSVLFVKDDDLSSFQDVALKSDNAVSYAISCLGWPVTRNQVVAVKYGNILSCLRWPDTSQLWCCDVR